MNINGRNIASLFYADDIVIITDEAEKLKKMLKIATNYGIKWRCKYNNKKTRVLILGKNKKENHDWETGIKKNRSS